MERGRLGHGARSPVFHWALGVCLGLLASQQRSRVPQRLPSPLKLRRDKPAWHAEVGPSGSKIFGLFFAATFRLAREMPSSSLWQRFQRYFLRYDDLHFSVDTSRMNFADDFFAKMQPRIDKAFKAMRQLEAGAIANPDEDRMVGHYWLRNPSLAPNAELRAEIEQTNSRIKEFAANVHAGKIAAANGKKFEHLLLIGIGGSALGPQFIADALATARDPADIYFFDNTDPDGFDRVFEKIGARLAQTLVIVISKSGGSTDQHAYVQQLRDGVLNFFVTFIEVQKDRHGPPFEVEKGVTSGDYLHGFLRGTRSALYENGRESITINIPDVDAASIGALIALYERTVGFYGSLVNINAYHQPGVEAGEKSDGKIAAIAESCPWATFGVRQNRGGTGACCRRGSGRRFSHSVSSREQRSERADDKGRRAVRRQVLPGCGATQPRWLNYGNG